MLATLLNTAFVVPAPGTSKPQQLKEEGPCVPHGPFFVGPETLTTAVFPLQVDLVEGRGQVCSFTVLGPTDLCRCVPLFSRTSIPFIPL